MSNGVSKAREPVKDIAEGDKNTLYWLLGVIILLMVIFLILIIYLIYRVCVITNVLSDLIDVVVEL